MPFSFTLQRARLVAAAAAVAALAAPAGALAATQNDTTQFSVTGGTLTFSSAPDLPNLPAVTVNGSSQNTTAQMTNFTVTDATGSGAGWNVTVNGDATGGKSAVFKACCPNASCGTDSGPGYVAGGATLAADSLVLNSTSATFSPATSAPTHQCNSGCNVDHGTAVKVVSAATNNGMGAFATSGWGASSLTLTTPANLAALQTNEVYRLDLLWSLTSGP